MQIYVHTYIVCILQVILCKKRHCAQKGAVIDTSKLINTKHRCVLCMHRSIKQLSMGSKTCLRSPKALHACKKALHAYACIHGYMHSVYTHMPQQPLYNHKPAHHRYTQNLSCAYTPRVRIPPPIMFKICKYSHKMNSAYTN